MIYINLVIIILIILFAVLGRKNKSKYKAKIRIAALEKLYLRKEVMTERKAREAAGDFVTGAIAVCMFILLIANVTALIYGICTRDRQEKENIILRQEYDGEESVFDLKLTDSEDEELYALKVAPVEYTEEEFDARTKEIYSELSVSILGENSDLEHISTDMCLSEYDKSEVIHLDWSSNQPEILSSDGRLDNLSISEGTDIRLDVVMEYGEYERSYSYDVYVEPAVSEESDSYGIKAAKEYIDKLEQEGRTNKEFTIPSEVSGVHIDLVEDKDYTQVKLLLLGICICLLCVSIRYFDLKEKADKADAELEAAYVGFVESLNLLIESGMTVKRAISHLASGAHIQKKLSDELKYAINMMDTGYDEVYAYEQLGTRLALPGYVRLFNYISQNIRKGNSNLKAVLNNCAYEAVQTGRENIKKRGEKTSTKLLFPMVLLLMAVMLVIIVPALMSF